MDGLATREKGARELTKRKYRDIMVVRCVASVYGHCRLVSFGLGSRGRGARHGVIRPQIERFCLQLLENLRSIFENTASLYRNYIGIPTTCS